MVGLLASVVTSAAMGQEYTASEGIRRLSVSVAIVSGIVGFFSIAASIDPSQIPKAFGGIVIVSTVIAAAGWGLTRLAAWTAAGFRINKSKSDEMLMKSKYDPLRRYLLSLDRFPVTMAFAEVERVLGFKIPPSARKYAAWWSNANPETGQHPYSGAWLSAGVRARANLEAEQVTFEKNN